MSSPNTAPIPAATPVPAGTSKSPLSARARAARPTPWLDGLNPAQREAVEALDGAVLMLAGAGTGKTRALTARIAHLVATGRARPGEIVAVTFTNRAAREMRERVTALLGPVAEGMTWMGTFHALSVRILRRHAELAGLRPNFTILDTDDQLRLIKQLLVARNMDEKRWPARLMLSLIDGWKNRALLPDRVPPDEAAAFGNLGAVIYAEYQERLRTLNAVDFGDLLLHCVTIFRNHADVLAQYQRRFRHILVDEYQDTNVAQYLWLRLLAQGHGNLCVVGDDDQSIYGWRGAEVGNILRFEKDFPGARVIRLEQNYRSTPHILAAASALIAANSERLGKTLWTDTESGELVRLIGHWDGEDEARWVGEEIEALARGTRGHDPVPLNDQAILVRAGHQMRAFEDRFLMIGLPYRVIGGPRFYERAEIRDAMAYLRLAASPGDDLAFERVVNLPRRGVGERAMQAIRARARDDGTSLFDAARGLVLSGMSHGRAGAGLRRFLDDVTRWHAVAVAMPAGAGEAETEPAAMPLASEAGAGPAFRAAHPGGEDGVEGVPARLAEMILEESGYVAMWQADRSPDAPGRLDNLKELVKALDEFDTLQGFLEHVSLVMENAGDDAASKVSLMTLHAAKGLEFRAVFLPGWEDGLFPSQRSLDEQGLRGLEEERRLAHVGITRAREICTISFASNRRVHGQWQSQLPSRFIDELPAAHVDVLTPPGLAGGGHGAGAPAARTVATGLEECATRADVYNSPGWKRLRERRAGGASVVSAPASARIARDGPLRGAGVDYAIGQRVFHQKFGYGRVEAVEGDKLDIAFEKAGSKKVVAGFLEPVAAGDASSR